VRHYKGVDLLLEAVRSHPHVHVTVAGEQWGEAGRRVCELAEEPDLRGRVQVFSGYVPAEQVPDLLRDHDVVALPYRSATASQNVLLAHAYGLPVLASRVGTFPEQVRDGVDGLLITPSDVGAISKAIDRLKEPTTMEELVRNVPEPDLDGPWHTYVRAVEEMHYDMRRR
jgi:glycosyltransferase involved in cell wall biosynthesis